MTPVCYHEGRFPPATLDWPALIPLIGPSAAAVARYDGMLAVSRDNDWTGWCRFFLEAVQVQAENNLSKAKAILDLYEDMKRRIPKMTRSQYAVHALDWIFERPIFKSSDFVHKAAIPEPTARRFLGVLQKGGIIKPVAPGRGRRASILVFSSLLNIAEGNKVF